MAQEQVHLQKAEVFWLLARDSFKRQATPFLCVNFAMYAVGHLVEALLARRGLHPSSQPRGVPHADRGALLKTALVPDTVPQAWADRYAELVGRRDTFIEGGIPQRLFAEEFMALAQPMVEFLQQRLSGHVKVDYGQL